VKVPLKKAAVPQLHEGNSSFWNSQILVYHSGCFKFLRLVKLFTVAENAELNEGWFAVMCHVFSNLTLLFRKIKKYWREINHTVSYIRPWRRTKSPSKGKPETCCFTPSPCKYFPTPKKELPVW
jgi:hypothetical protein